MSAVGKAFIKAIGKPSPRLPFQVPFHHPGDRFSWKAFTKEIGAGWYLDRFLLLFCEQLAALQACVDRWAFLGAPSTNRVILGRNAHGAILTLENDESPALDSHVCVLDPLHVTWWSDPNAGLSNLLGYWFGERALPAAFLDDSVYARWRKETGEALADDEILAIKVPLSLGGTLDLSNFQVENIDEYFATTGPIYARASGKTRKRPGAPRRKR